MTSNIMTRNIVTRKIVTRNLIPWNVVTKKNITRYIGPSYIMHSVDDLIRVHYPVPPMCRRMQCQPLRTVSERMTRRSCSRSAPLSMTLRSDPGRSGSCPPADER